MSGLRAWLLLVCLLTPTVEARPPIRGERPAIVGMASWYGYQFANRLQANGKRFRPLAISAASRSLPLGTRVRVFNLRNQRSLELTITDRGPYRSGRILDLSLGAAKQLRMVQDGVVPVRIELVAAPARA